MTKEGGEEKTHQDNPIQHDFPIFSFLDADAKTRSLKNRCANDVTIGFGVLPKPKIQAAI